jgi:septum formation protein
VSDRRRLVLASTSRYRKALLERLGLPFETASPEIDETPLAGESVVEMVERLAVAKAVAVAESLADALVIGSDQSVELDGEILGKPGSVEAACAQLARLSGRRATFQTGLALLDGRSGRVHSLVEPFTVHFRTLTNEQIEGYVAQEQPLDCAGSFKSEALGIALFRKMEGDDPNALIGLPLIRLIDLLAGEGVDPLASAHA